MSNPASKTPPAPPAVSSGKPESDNDIVSIYNRSPKHGDVVHDIYEQVKDSDGKVIGQKVAKSYRAEAGAFCQVPRWLARLWMKQNPDRIVSAESVGAPKDHDPGKVATLERQNAEMADRMKNLEALVEKLQASGKA